MAPPSINTQVLIDSSNKWIPLRIKIGMAAWNDRTTSIAEQTYGDITEVCDAVQAAIRLVGGGAEIPNATCSVVFDGAVPGMIRFDYSADLGAGDQVEMDWLNNNPHGSAFNDDHIGTVLGFDDLADDGPIAVDWYFTSDWQHTDGWYAIRAIRSYGPPLPNHVGGEFRKVLSQKYAKILTVGWEYTYDFVLESIDPWHMLWTKCVGANTNRAFDYVFEKMIKGEWFRVREDQEVLGTFLNCYLAEPRRHQDNVVRAFPDYEVYNLSLRFTGRIL
jgi:hypothetical protein